MTMLPTSFQKLAVDHVSIHNDAMPLDYPSLKNGGFEAVYFRPEEGAVLVSQRIDYAQKQDTFRGTKFDGNVWFADPGSADSLAAGFPTDAYGWASAVVHFVTRLSGLGFPPKVLKLNVEFTGKGYPPWKAGIVVKPWMHIYASGPDGVPRLYFTPNGGTTGQTRPRFTGVVNDNGVTWQLDDPNGSPYQYYRGWQWNAAAAATIRNWLPNQLVMTQPLGGQGDFNRGAWYKIGARESPQCYGDQPYHDLRDPGAEIDLVDNDVYAKAWHGLDLDRRLVHPTIGAYGQSSYYVPRLKAARTKGLFGFCLYRHDAFKDSDYAEYRQFVVT